jgi:NitT/TauT family transport system substrate-binding protein
LASRREKRGAMTSVHSPQEESMRVRKLITLVVAAGLAAAIVGTAIAASGRTAARQVTDISIATLPVADSALAQIAMDQGFFAKHGLNAKFNVVTIGPATTAAIVSGASQFSQSNYATLIQARNQHLPIQIVSEAARVSAGFSGVYVLPDSSIQSAKDLEGKRVATSVIGGIGPVLINEWLKSKDVDYTKIQWVQMGFGSMGAALQQHQIDAAWVVEPVTTQIKEQLSVRLVLDLGIGVTNGVPFAGWATNEVWAKKNPSLVRGFQLAIRDAGVYAHAHPGSIQHAITEYTSLKDADVGKLHLEFYPQVTSSPAIARVAKYMKDTGALATTFHVEKMIWPQPKVAVKKQK